MKKLVIFMTLALAMSTLALANPVFQDRGAKASNPMYEGTAKDVCPNDKCIAPEKVALTIQTWTDPDSDGDGVPTLVSTEVVGSNQGQIVSAIKSERPKFKAGAELSKTVNSMDTGDLDGDGFADIAIGIERNGDTFEVTGTEIDKKDIRKGFIKTENHMNKAELIEAMASEAGLSKEESAGVLDAFINATTKASDKR